MQRGPSSFFCGQRTIKSPPERVFYRVFYFYCIGSGKLFRQDSMGYSSLE